MRGARLLAAATVMAFVTHGAAADSVRLHAAGSLRTALTEVAAAYEADGGTKVSAMFGPSGLLKDKIAQGESAEVFASANMTHPRALHDAGKSGPVVLFARNDLCALVRPGLAVETDTLLATMLDPAVKVGTSTPKADPSGDYAFEVFAKAEKVKAGARVALEAKARQLTGGPTSRTASKGKSLYGELVSSGEADLFLTYCTNAAEAQREYPTQSTVALPDSLGVGADYGLTVMKDASPDALRFALFILGTDGQALLAKHGFKGVGLPR
jgi:molybdenum ABC transporter molybdate-binding protein